MKKILLTSAFFLISLCGYAQDYSSDVDVYMGAILKAHTQSEHVQSIKENIETQYNVDCVGDSTGAIFPFYFPVTYKAKCLGEKNSLILKIHSVYKGTENEKNIFVLKNYKIKIKN